MEIEVLSRKNNEFLNRVEIEFKISHTSEASPKRTSVKSAIAKLESAKPELVVIDGMHTEYGHSSLKGFAKVYKNKEDALGLERRHILLRNGLISDDKKEKKPQPKAEGEKTEPKAEEPAEEEPKTEKKPDKPEAKETKPKEETKPEKDKAAKSGGSESEK